MRVRILLGDPDQPKSRNAAPHEGIDDAMAAKIRERRSSCTGRCATLDGVEFRLHGTVLYNSIYRADDQLLVNTHIYGARRRRHRSCTCAGSPAAAGHTYLDSFERVWRPGRPTDDGGPDVARADRLLRRPRRAHAPTASSRPRTSSSSTTPARSC